MKSTTTVRKYVIAGSFSLSLSPAMFAQTHKAPPRDWQIEAQVQKAIADDHIFVGSSIMSSVNRGVVKLTGNVPVRQKGICVVGPSEYPRREDRPQKP